MATRIPNVPQVSTMARVSRHVEAALGAYTDPGERAAAVRVLSEQHVYDDPAGVIMEVCMTEGVWMRSAPDPGAADDHVRAGLDATADRMCAVGMAPPGDGVARLGVLVRRHGAYMAGDAPALREAAAEAVRLGADPVNAALAMGLARWVFSGVVD